MIKVDNIKLKIDYKDQDIRNAISKALRIPVDHVEEYQIIKRSLDARKKPNLFYMFVLHVKVANEKVLVKKQKKLQQVQAYDYVYPTYDGQAQQPIIVGFGPAGLFAAHVFAKAGLKPIVIEQGEAVEARTKSVEEFWSTGLLNLKSNVQFGEGGAGTFSDGKLTTRSKDPRSKKVLEVLVAHGAPKEILYSNKPHVGTDILKDVVVSMRKEIVDLGGQIHFSTQMTDLILKGQDLVGIQTDQGDFMSDKIVLALGNSGRSAYEILHKHGVKIEQKPFAMGLRIEHHQKMIDENQYGSLEARKHIGASDYKLTHKASNGRSVYSFCVCPGGMVVASASEAGGLVVNGMSEYKRNEENINSALLVQVSTEDFGSDHPLAGMYYQRKYEQMAFALTSDFRGPVQTVGDFIDGSGEEYTGIVPSYKPAVVHCDLSQCLPAYITEALKEGLVAFGKKIKGFDRKDAVLTGLESRSSAPLRILRDHEKLESVNMSGLYPIGEGAGYAGGIVSSAIDGIKAAEVILNL